jgi:uncharacterized short protein YbdD (DUF466 family)
MRRETEGGRRGKGSGVLPRVARILRQVVGAPDYDAYLEHCRRAGHPPRLNERDYVREFFEAKGKCVRCC